MLTTYEGTKGLKLKQLRPCSLKSVVSREYERLSYYAPSTVLFLKGTWVSILCVAEFLGTTVCPSSVTCRLPGLRCDRTGHLAGQVSDVKKYMAFLIGSPREGEGLAEGSACPGFCGESSGVSWEPEWGLRR